jgi:membrane protein
MLAKIWALIKDTISGFITHDVLSRGAAIAYFTIFSLAPLLIIVIAVASLVFGHDAAQHAIIGQFGGLMGSASGDALQTMIKGASLQDSGTMATIIGVVTLLITASGAFGTIQSSLNVIWDATPQAGLSRLVLARIASLGLVLTLGFLMLASLVISAALSALGSYLDSIFPAAHPVMEIGNFIISVALLSVVFGAIFKFLPDKPIAWSDVAAGAIATSLLFAIGNSLIGLYIGKTHIASGYGAAGALIIVLVWIYYSSLIFLLGAEFTRAFAQMHGSHAPARTGSTEGAAASTANPSEALARQAAFTRQRMDGALQLVRARAAQPAWPDGARRRPSLLQMAVAALALATLPSPRRVSGQQAAPRGAPPTPPAAIPQTIGVPARQH